MAKREPNSGSIKKGEVRNPGGKPALPEDLRLLMRSTGEQMKRDLCEVYLMPLSELQRAEQMDKTKLSAGRAALMSCLNNSYSSGDFKALNVILDRVLGKVPEAKEDSEEQNPARESLVKELMELNSVDTESGDRPRD